MKRIFLNILVATIIAVFFGVGTVVAGQMSIKFLPGSDGSVKIGVVGSGTVSIDWGDDDSEKLMYELDESCELDNFTYYGYIYLSTSVRTIIITGENVTSLNCSAVRLINLDVSSNPVLMVLWCAYGQLTTLDVSRNTALKSLDCSQNQLMTLDVSHNISIQFLNCSYNMLTTLDVSQNKALAELHCSNNRLMSLNVSRNTALKALSYDKDNVQLITR